MQTLQKTELIYEFDETYADQKNTRSFDRGTEDCPGLLSFINHDLSYVVANYAHA